MTRNVIVAACALGIAGFGAKGVVYSVLTIDGAAVDGPRPVTGRREKP